jgi:hypothetical protein
MFVLWRHRSGKRLGSPWSGTRVAPKPSTSSPLPWPTQGMHGADSMLATSWMATRGRSGQRARLSLRVSHIGTCILMPWPTSAGPPAKASKTSRFDSTGRMSGNAKRQPAGQGSGLQVGILFGLGGLSGWSAATGAPADCKAVWTVRRGDAHAFPQRKKSVQGCWVG